MLLLWECAISTLLISFLLCGVELRPSSRADESNFSAEKEIFSVKLKQMECFTKPSLKNKRLMFFFFE